MNVDRAAACKAMLAGLAVPLLLELPSVAAGQTGQKAGIHVLLRQPLPNVPGKEITLIHVEYASSASSPAHRHPGFTVGYVLAGAVVSKVGDGAEKTYGTGEFFTETPNAAHSISRNASATQPASLLAILVADAGATLTEPIGEGHA